MGLERLRAVLDVDRKDFPHLSVRGHAVYNGLFGHAATFGSPNPPLPAFLIKLNAFDEAQQLALTHAPGAATARDLSAGELITCLETTRAYVQGLADGCPLPGQAAIVIQSAGMLIAGTTHYSKPLLQAKQSMPGAPVRLIANVGVLTTDTKGKVFFGWQYSLDGGKTWVTAASTPHGNTVIASLAPMEYAFRVNVTDGSGPGAWTDSVLLQVR